MWQGPGVAPSWDWILSALALLASHQPRNHSTPSYSQYRNVVICVVKISATKLKIKQWQMGQISTIITQNTKQIFTLNWWTNKFWQLVEFKCYILCWNCSFNELTIWDAIHFHKSQNYLQINKLSFLLFLYFVSVSLDQNKQISFKRNSHDGDLHS